MPAHWTRAFPTKRFTTPCGATIAVRRLVTPGCARPIGSRGSRLQQPAALLSAYPIVHE